MTISKEELAKHNHENVWQYIISVGNGLSAMQIYKLEAMHYLKCKQNNFIDVVKGRTKIRDDEKNMFPPGDYHEIDGVNVSLTFLVWLNAQNLIHTGRNCFDYMAQIIFDYFPNITKRKIDFGTIYNNKDKISDNRVVEWLIEIEGSDCFKYINDFSNTIKHNHDISPSISIKTSDLEIMCYIPNFEKENRIHSKNEYSSKLDEVYKFTADSYNRLLPLLMEND